MSVFLISLLAVAGIAAVFVVPWIGAAFLIAAVIVGAALAVSAFGARRERAPVEAPHLPGPGGTETGVD